MTIPWGRVWLTLATLVAAALAVGFVLHYLGILVTA
jgi:hypothetical protein